MSIDVLAFSSLDEQGVALPSALMRLIWEPSNILDRVTYYVEWHPKSVRVHIGEKVRKQKSSRRWILLKIRNELHRYCSKPTGS